MTNVVRYHPNRDGGMCEASSGPWVRIEDYELLVAEIAYIKAGERVRQVEETRCAIRAAEKAERNADNGTGE